MCTIFWGVYLRFSLIIINILKTVHWEIDKNFLVVCLSIQRLLQYKTPVIWAVYYKHWYSKQKSAHTILPGERFLRFYILGESKLQQHQTIQETFINKQVYVYTSRILDDGRTINRKGLIHNHNDTSRLAHLHNCHCWSPPQRCHWNLLQNLIAPNGHQWTVIGKTRCFTLVFRQWNFSRMRVINFQR